MTKSVVLTKEGWTSEVEAEVYRLLTEGVKPKDIKPTGAMTYWDDITFLCKKNALYAELRKDKGQLKIKTNQ